MLLNRTKVEKEIAIESCESLQDTLEHLRGRSFLLAGDEIIEAYVGILKSGCDCQDCNRRIASFEPAIKQMIDTLEPIHSDRIAKLVEYSKGKRKEVLAMIAAAKNVFQGIFKKST